MELVGVVKFSKTHSKVISVVGAAALVAFIALCNWRITARIPLGFLYLVPMFLFGRTLGRGWIVCLAAACTALAEAYDDFPLTVSEGLPRILVYFAAFVTTGLFVREISRNRLQALVYIHEIEEQIHEIEEQIHEIEEQRDALREAENQLEALIESSPAAIATTDASGHILMANEAAHRLFGAASESLSERLIQEFVPSFANVSDGRSSHPRFRAVMQSRGFRDDGEMFLADICFSTYPTASGNRLTAMLVDTSEDLREHEEASLRQLMTGSRLVAGAMSHEIRNVCAAIGIVHLNLVRSGLITANQDFEALGGLIQTLEDLAAVELSYTAPQSSEVDLVAALNDLRIVISPGLHELNIETAWTTDEELPKVWGESFTAHADFFEPQQQ